VVVVVVVGVVPVDGETVTVGIEPPARRSNVLEVR
jgi:hypothetical protein